jgi:hypothetical protein
MSLPPQAGRTAPSDEYEAREMGDVTGVIHRDKSVARALAMTMGAMSTAALAVGAATILGVDPNAPWPARLAPVLVGLLFGFVGLTRSVVRTVVTADEVRVHWGLAGPRIPIRSITRCAVQPGPGPGQPRLVASRSILPAVRGMIRIDHTDEAGAAQSLILSAGDPALLADKINAARAQSAAAADARPANVRVAASPEAATADEVEESAAEASPLRAER